MDVDQVKAKLPIEQLVQLMLDDELSVEQINVGIDEYCRLLALLSSTEESLRPTKLADEVLHRHLEMPSFDEDCLSIVGKRVHHVPHAEESLEMTAMWHRTRELMLAKFSIDPAVARNDNSKEASSEHKAPCFVTTESAAPCFVTSERAAPCSVTSDRAA
ncbi:hypothetical protein JL100_024265 [Skermanella mucosa]|uniref:hypothetical protein n=1 Tax=Skermanella mucosa TaxID=1789672 RepID=UPI00192C8BEF|nr:hypothetical protein [Skermanella mucosa]UEM20158.1 hypothetical protein JL100_024265 [Skermanella mucosa]